MGFSFVMLVVLGLVCLIAMASRWNSNVDALSYRAMSSIGWTAGLVGAALTIGIIATEHARAPEPRSPYDDEYGYEDELEASDSWWMDCYDGGYCREPDTGDYLHLVFWALVAGVVATLLVGWLGSEGSRLRSLVDGAVRSDVTLGDISSGLDAIDTTAATIDEAMHGIRATLVGDRRATDGEKQ